MKGINKNRREILDFPIENGWIIRTYIEKLPKGKDDFIFMVEHQSEKDSIIRFDQSLHKYFHVDILNEKKKPFKEFPGIMDINQKIDCVFNFITKDLNCIIKHNENTITLNIDRLEEIKKSYKNELQNGLKIGKRTTSVNITGRAMITKG